VVLAALDHPAIQPGVPVGQVVPVDGEYDIFGFPGPDGHAGERLELTTGAADRGAREAHVHLDHFPAVPVAVLLTETRTSMPRAVAVAVAWR